VVHGIIQEHGGQIEVESELQKGTSFHILLPVVRFENKVAAA
jgi:signal transduction histidine kinase